jgi:hypothetical protein
VTTRSAKRRVMVQAGLGKKKDPISKKIRVIGLKV